VTHLEASRWTPGLFCSLRPSDHVRRMAGRTQAGYLLRNGLPRLMAASKKGVSSKQL
jgi:hypothetical protein